MAEEKKVSSQDEETLEEFADKAAEEITADSAADELEPATQEDVAEDVSDEAKGAKRDKKKGKAFGKKKDLKDKKDEIINELNDKLKRSMAEFDNFRKRTNQEKAGMYVVGAKEIVEKMLPVVDSFERGLAAVPQDEEATPFIEGMTMIYKQMLKALEDVGVTPIVAVGEEFDPDLHNAVMHIESDEVGDNIVVEELQKGYHYKDFVVRHSMVKVAN